MNDARNVRNFLRRHGYKKEDIVILTDDAPDPRSKPTRVNILDAMHWLVKDAQPNDSLFFHCELTLRDRRSCSYVAYSNMSDSGHGGQVKDRNGDEIDGYDEG